MASANMRLSRVLRAIILCSRIVASAARCALSTTKSDRLRPWSAAARCNSSFCSALIRASRRSRFGASESIYSFWPIRLPSRISCVTQQMYGRSPYMPSSDSRSKAANGFCSTQALASSALFRAMLHWYAKILSQQHSDVLRHSRPSFRSESGRFMFWRQQWQLSTIVIR